MKRYTFTIQQGYQVASGIAGDPKFPIGTIAEQIPFFKSLGLNLEHIFRGTINARFNCSRVVLNRHDYYFRTVKWHKNFPAEDFKFYSCSIIANNIVYPAFIYQPQKETKPSHFQPANQLELLSPYIKSIGYDSTLILECDDRILTLT